MRLAMNTRIVNFEQALTATKPRGIQDGFHSNLLRLADLGLIAGINESAIIAAIKTNTSGYRTNEVEQAVSRAKLDFKPDSNSRPYKPIQRQEVESSIDWLELRTKFIERGYNGLKDKLLIYCDLWEASYSRIYDRPEKDSILILENLFLLDDVLFLGDTFSTTVKSVKDWLSDLKILHSANMYSRFPHIIWNPLSGQPGLTKEGKQSYRADSCVKSFRYAVAEFDTIPKEDQAALWLFLITEKNYPVAALIDSGGKSIHAILAVNIKDSIKTNEDWTAEIEEKLYNDFLIPLGCDAACKNESRLSRLPGHFRQEKGQFQRLLYLNPSVAGF